MFVNSITMTRPNCGFVQLSPSLPVQALSRRQNKWGQQPRCAVNCSRRSAVLPGEGSPLLRQTLTAFFCAAERPIGKRKSRRGYRRLPFRLVCLFAPLTSAVCSSRKARAWPVPSAPAAVWLGAWAFRANRPARRDRSRCSSSRTSFGLTLSPRWPRPNGRFCRSTSQAHRGTRRRAPQ